MRSEEDAYEEDAYEEYSNIPVYIYGGATRVAGNGVPEGDGREASNRSFHSSEFLSSADHSVPTSHYFINIYLLDLHQIFPAFTE